MKGRLRQALVFALVFVITASQLAGVAFAEDSTKKVNVSGFWDLISFEVYTDNPALGDNDLSIDLFKGAIKVKQEGTSSNSKVAYDQAVANMQSQMGTSAIKSNGAAIITIPFTRFESKRYSSSSPYYVGYFSDYGTPTVADTGSIGYYWKGSVNISSGLVTLNLYPEVARSNLGSFATAWYRFKFPFTGKYTFLGFGEVHGEVLDDNAKLYEFPVWFGQSQGGQKKNQPYIFMSGDSINIFIDCIESSIKNPRSVKLTVPQNLEAEFESLDSFYKEQAGNYVENSGSRAGAITTNYGYMNEDGEQIITDNVQIVNESGKVYYNPITGNTTAFNDWTYDYSTRTYTVNNTTGDTTTITYGDEHMTITEGDTVYNYYYITNNNGSSSSTGDSSSGGSSSGGNNNNDGNGGSVLDKLGDIIFGTLGDTIAFLINGLADLLKPVVKALADAITGIVDEILKGLGSITALILRLFAEVPALFSGFTGFLAAVFPFFPPDVIMLIELGILLVIAGAVIKKITG